MLLVFAYLACTIGEDTSAGLDTPASKQLSHIQIIADHSAEIIRLSTQMEVRAQQAREHQDDAQRDQDRLWIQQTITKIETLNEAIMSEAQQLDEAVFDAAQVRQQNNPTNRVQ